MKKYSKILSAVFIVAFLLSFTAASFAEEKAHERRIRLSAELINKMANESDASGLADVIASGRGVAIFPAVTKAGFVLGGQTGEGVVFVKDSRGNWNGPAFMGLSGASVGFLLSPCHT